MPTTTEKRFSAAACSKAMFEHFDEQGFLEPIRVLSKQECRRFVHAAHDRSNYLPLTWFKGQAASNHPFYTIATHPKIIEVVACLLGENIMLYGANIVQRAPNRIHPWHSDSETSALSGKSVSVWIGLKHTTADSSLIILPYSHRFGITVQEVRAHYGRPRDETTDADITQWGQDRDPRSHVLQPHVTDGEALFFDGQLWHSSHNQFQNTRQALVLNYATPDTKIWITDSNNLDWPFQRRTHPRPPCLMVRGRDQTGVNRIVSPPPPPQKKSRSPVCTGIYPLDIPLPPDEKKGWKPYPLFHGSTNGLQNLTCHVSVLTKNHCPHPPHTHQEEELLLLLSGEVDLILPDDPGLEADQRMRIKPGHLVYYPTGFAHTLQAVSEEPANYLMLKWKASPTRSHAPLSFGHYAIFECLENHIGKEGFCPQRLFEGPTAYMNKLHCHVSTLTPGAGYGAHSDAYDIAIIVLEGEVETLGKRAGAHSVIFYKAGDRHGMFNPGKDIAKYVVFEFHGKHVGSGRTPYQRIRSLLTKLRDPKRWKRKVKHLGKQVKTRVMRSFI